MMILKSQDLSLLAMEIEDGFMGRQIYPGS